MPTFIRLHRDLRLPLSQNSQTQIVGQPPQEVFNKKLSATCSNIELISIPAARERKAFDTARKPFHGSARFIVGTRLSRRVLILGDINSDATGIDINLQSSTVRCRPKYSGSQKSEVCPRRPMPYGLCP